MPVQLKSESDEMEEDGSILVLRGLLGALDGEYFSFSDPIHLVSAPNSAWLQFDGNPSLNGKTSVL